MAPHGPIALANSRSSLKNHVEYTQERAENFAEWLLPNKAAKRNASPIGQTNQLTSATFNAKNIELPCCTGQLPANLRAGVADECAL